MYLPGRVCALGVRLVEVRALGVGVKADHDGGNAKRPLAVGLRVGLLDGGNVSRDVSAKKKKKKKKRRKRKKMM